MWYVEYILLKKWACDRYKRKATNIKTPRKNLARLFSRFEMSSTIAQKKVTYIGV
jgi:hypothetical protein